MTLFRPHRIWSDTLPLTWGHETRGSQLCWARHVSPRVLPASHCLGIVVTPVTGASSRHTGASVGDRDHTSRGREIQERGEASVGPASHTASVTPQAAPQSTLLRIMLLKSALSQTGRVTGDRVQRKCPAPMARWLLLLSGITCIILATVAPQTIKQEMKIIGSSQYLDWWNTRECFSFSLTQGIAELQFNV